MLTFRLLIATAGTTMEFADVIVRESQPLAYSALDTVVTSLFRLHDSFLIGLWARKNCIDFINS